MNSVDESLLSAYPLGHGLAFMEAAPTKPPKEHTELYDTHAPMLVLRSLEATEGELDRGYLPARRDAVVRRAARAKANAWRIAMQTEDVVELEEPCYASILAECEGMDEDCVDEFAWQRFESELIRLYRQPLRPPPATRRLDTESARRAAELRREGRHPAEQLCRTFHDEGMQECWENAVAARDRAEKGAAVRQWDRPLLSRVSDSDPATGGKALLSTGGWFVSNLMWGSWGARALDGCAVTTATRVAARAKRNAWSWAMGKSVHQAPEMSGVCNQETLDKCPRDMDPVHWCGQMLIALYNQPLADASAAIWTHAAAHGTLNLGKASEDLTRLRTLDPTQKSISFRLFMETSGQPGASGWRAHAWRCEGRGEDI